jgi:hypothetical protein
MLFHYACSLAAEGHRVVFACRNAKMEAAPPLLPPGVGPGDPLLANISMRCAYLPRCAAHLALESARRLPLRAPCAAASPPTLLPHVLPMHRRYLETLRDIVKYAACFHLAQPPPAALIVDGLSDIAAASRCVPGPLLPFPPYRLGAHSYCFTL